MGPWRRLSSVTNVAALPKMAKVYLARIFGVAHLLATQLLVAARMDAHLTAHDSKLVAAVAAPNAGGVGGHGDAAVEACAPPGADTSGASPLPYFGGGSTLRSR